MPVAPQVCTPLPMHWVVAGVQVPVHAPPTHASLVQVTGLPHWPAEVQVWRPAVPEHCTLPGVQLPVHWPP